MQGSQYSGLEVPVQISEDICTRVFETLYQDMREMCGRIEE